MYTIFDERNKLWGSLGLENPKVLTSQAILRLLFTNGLKVAQINADTGLQITFHEMWLKTVRAAQNLQKRDFKSREIFCFMANNNDQLAPMILASFCLACPILPLHPALSKDEIIRILEISKPSVIFSDAKVYSQLNEALEELTFTVKVFIFGEHANELESVDNLLIETGDEDNFVPINYDIENDIAGIFCSSGTTGPSKCVCVPYGSNLLEPASYTEKGSVILSLDNIFWAICIRPILDSIYNCATRIITMKSFTAELQLKLIEKYKVDVLFNPPFNLVACMKNPLMLKTDFSNVKTIFFYEIGYISQSFLDVSSDANSGQLIDGCVVKIVDDQGNRCGPNVSGEICTQTKIKFLGYYNDEQATVDAVDNEGFFLTGDFGHFNENGVFFFDDRKKNIIRVYYFRAVIMPLEIEEYLITLPDVKDVCIVGIPIACGAALPAAVIVRKPNSNLTRRKIFNEVADHFPNRSKLRKLRGGVYFVESLNKTLSGKLLRRNITELAVELFAVQKRNDGEIQSFFSDIPDEFKNLI